MTKLTRLLLAAALIAGFSPATAQQFPTVPDHTVIGRIGTGISSGPSQAIPFTSLAPQLGVHNLPEIYASDPAYGVKCDGSTDDASALQRAVTAADAMGGAIVVLPVGTCPIGSTVQLNKWAAPGILTVPGIKIRGQGRGVTILDTRVSSGYVIAANPSWRAAHQAAFSTAAGTSGTLATNTYYLQITENDGLGHEIVVTLPKAISVTGPTGSVTMTLPALSPGYSYNIYFDTASTPAHYALINGGNASAIGPGTVTITALGSARAIPTGTQAVWQEASISDLSIINSAGTANASGIQFFKVGYSDLTNIYMKGLTGDGFGITNYTGDVDGSFNVAVHNSKFDTIAGTCVNAAGNVLELSNFTVDDRTVFNICGTAPTNLGTAVTISSIQNNSSPVVTTSTPHNLLAGDQVAFSVSGMTLSSTWYRVGSTVTATTFNLVDLNGNAVNTTSLGAFTSGTVALAWRPPQISGGVVTGGGGCLAWTGLIGTFRNLDFTQCNNFAMYFSEAGSSDNATIENVDFENTAGKGLYAASLISGTLKNFECLTTSGLGNTISCVQEGTGFAGGGVQNFLIDVGKVRSNVAPATAFEQFKNTNNGATFQDTNRVRNITWQSFDAANQTRFSGFVFDPIPGQATFSISSTNTAQLIPTGYGSAIPMKLKATGEWVAYHVPQAGLSLGSLSGTATTTYYFYLYNSGTSLAPYSAVLEQSSTAPVLDAEGYYVKSGDSTRTLVGTATTDGSGNFQTTGAQTSQYPPGGGVGIGTGSLGALAYYSAPSALSPTAVGGVGTVFVGQGAAAPVWTRSPQLGLAGSAAGSLIFANATSGTITIQPATGALGSAVITVPAITDTLAGKALANGGTNNSLTASNGGIVWSDASKLNILAGTATANLPILSGATATPAWATISYPTSANSGGIPYFSSTTVMASSATLTLNGVVYGGGAGAAPQATAQGGANTVLTANAGAPVFSASPTIGTSVTVPLVLGGTAAGSSLTLQSTSGVGSGDSVVVKTGNNGSLTTARITQTGLGVNTNGNPISDFQVGGAGGTNAGFEVAVSSAITIQAYNRNTSSYAGLTFDGASVAFRIAGSGSNGLYLSNAGGISVGVNSDPGQGGILANGLLKSQSATAGIGYATGAGGAVTQTTSRTTGVTLNNVTGAITLVSAAGSASFQSFTLTNSAIAANDVVKVVQKSGTDLYEIFVTNIAAGSCKITFATTGGTTTEQPVFNFVVIKGSAS